MVGPQARRTVHRSGDTAVELRVLFGASDKEGTRLGEDGEARVIQIAPIEQVTGSGLQHQLVQQVDVVDLPPVT